MDLQSELSQIDPDDIDATFALLEKHGATAGDAPDNTTGGDGEGDGTNKGESAPAEKAEGNGSATHGAATESDPQGVLLKDGKTVAPYGVLKGERQARQAAEARARDLEAALERMKSEAATSGKDGTPSQQATDDAAEFSDEELTSLGENFPELAKLVKGYRAQAQRINELYARTKQAPNAQPAGSKPDDDAEGDATVQLQTAINANPLLAKWQDKGGLIWGRAVEVDAELQADAAWADKPLAQRLAEVERLVADELGIQRTPPQTQTNGGKPNTKGKPNTREADDIETLSDIGGRTPVPEQDEIAALTTGQLRAKFEGMSDDAIDRLLMRGG